MCTIYDDDILYNAVCTVFYRGVGLRGGMRARVADEVRGRSRVHDAVGLGVEGQLSDRRQRVDQRRRHTRHTLRHAAGVRLGPGSRKSINIEKKQKGADVGCI